MSTPYVPIDEYVKRYEAKRNQIAEKLREFKKVRESRDSLILEASEYDFTYEDIAYLSGVTVVTIRNIRKRHGLARIRKIYGRSSYRADAKNERKIQSV